MEIYPGEELYYYSDLLSDLQSGKAMTMNGTNCVLVEFGVMVQYRDLLQAVQKPGIPFVKGVDKNSQSLLVCHELLAPSCSLSPARIPMIRVGV